MKKLTALAALAALAIAPGAAHAQDAGLTADQVRGYFDDISSKAETAVQNNNWSGIQSWLSENVADTATIAVKGSLIVTGGPAGTYSFVMDGAELKKFGRMSMGHMQMGDSDMLEDYSLDVQVQAANDLPGDQASALVVFSESGRLAPPAHGGASEGMMDELFFESISTCVFRLAPSGDESRPDIVGAACDSNTMM